jgi:hypothetical protein
MNEQQIQRELKQYFEGIFKDFPLLKLSVDMNMTFTFISNRAEDYRRLEFDLIIQNNGRPFILIEIKSDKFFSNIKDNAIISLADDAFKITNSRYFILTDGSRFKLVDSKTLAVEEIQKKSLSSIFNAPDAIKKDIEENKRYLLDLLKNGIERLGLQDKWQLNFSEVQEDEVFEYNEDDRTFSFKGDSNNFDSLENRFFKSLLPDFKGSIIYRYTTVSTLESMLKNNTFRMNGINGMNDPTEIDYADSIVFGGRRPLVEWEPSEVEEINKVFITSCSDARKRDDLTLWRLYGDDSKGVSLKLKVENATKLSNKMIVAAVSYGARNGEHKELELIKQFADEFFKLRRVKFLFKNYNIWKHFFKSHHYEVEKEVRLLYLKNDYATPMSDGWVVTYSDKIFNPTVDFKLNDESFPLKLQEITLGPNMPEKNVNKAQISEYIRQLQLNPDYNITGLNIRISSINNYRKA